MRGETASERRAFAIGSSATRHSPLLPLYYQSFGNAERFFEKKRTNRDAQRLSRRGCWFNCPRREGNKRMLLYARTSRATAEWNSRFSQMSRRCAIKEREREREGSLKIQRIARSSASKIVSNANRLVDLRWEPPRGRIFAVHAARSSIEDRAIASSSFFPVSPGQRMMENARVSRFLANTRVLAYA